MLRLTPNRVSGSESSFASLGSSAAQIAQAPAVEYLATLWLNEPQLGHR
jgi:hypothetical protein